MSRVLAVHDVVLKPFVLAGLHGFITFYNFFLALGDVLCMVVIMVRDTTPRAGHSKKGLKDMTTTTQNYRLTQRDNSGRHFEAAGTLDELAALLTADDKSEIVHVTAELLAELDADEDAINPYENGPGWYHDDLCGNVRRFDSQLEAVQYAASIDQRFSAVDAIGEYVVGHDYYGDWRVLTAGDKVEWVDPDDCERHEGTVKRAFDCSTVDIAFDDGDEGSANIHECVRV